MVNGSTRSLREQVHSLAADIFYEESRKTKRDIVKRIDKMSRDQLLATLESVNDVEDWGDLADAYADAYADAANPWWYH